MQDASRGSCRRRGNHAWRIGPRNTQGDRLAGRGHNSGAAGVIHPERSVLSTQNCQRELASLHGDDSPSSRRRAPFLGTPTLALADGGEARLVLMAPALTGASRQHPTSGRTQRRWPSHSASYVGGSNSEQEAVENFQLASDLGHWPMRHHVVNVRHTPWMKGYDMTWTSDSKWIVVHSTLVTLVILSWAYIPA